MYPALFLSFGVFTLLATVLIWQRMRAERQNQRLLALESDAAELGLLEET
jgi:hypothetical protein